MITKRRSTVKQESAGSYLCLLALSCETFRYLKKPTILPPYSPSVNIGNVKDFPDFSVETCWFFDSLTVAEIPFDIVTVRIA